MLIKHLKMTKPCKETYSRDHSSRMSDRSKSRSRSRSRSRSKGGEKSDDGSGEEEIYEVEEIRDKRRGEDGDWLYYVKWVS